MITQNQENYEGMIEDLIGYHFNNPELLTQAFTRRSYSSENGGLDNEELEFIGDSILNALVVKVFVDNYGRMRHWDEDFDSNEEDDGFYFDDEDEASLSKLKSKIVCKKSLAEAIDNLGLAQYLYMGEGDIKNHAENEPSVKEDLFEAIIGAVAIDSDYNWNYIEEALDVMLNLSYKISKGKEDVDYVGIIQQWCQKHDSYLPKYSFERLNNDTFRCLIDFNSRDYGYRLFKGDGYSKQESRIEAAKNFYLFLQQNNLLYTIEDELPEEITLDNAINVLQELAQKGYQDMPIYNFSNGTVPYTDGSMRWECECIIRNKGIKTSTNSTSKKDAKKYAAYLALCEEFDLEDEYSED